MTSPPMFFAISSETITYNGLLNVSLALPCKIGRLNISKKQLSAMAAIAFSFFLFSVSVKFPFSAKVKRVAVSISGMISRNRTAVPPGTYARSFMSSSSPCAYFSCIW